MDILLIPIVLLPLVAQWKVKSNYNKYLKKQNSINISGAEAARKILDKNGLTGVDIIKTSGLLSDHYDPTKKTVALSKEVYEGKTIASIAIAAHEVGHAIQDKEAYSFLIFRTKMVPAVNITSKLSSIILVIGFFLGFVGLINFAIGLLCISLLFQLITLPVEFNASDRAKIQLETIGLLADEDTKGIKKMLSAAAFTYVASFLASALQVIRLIAMANRRK